MNNTKIIIGARGSGKTTQLVRFSAENAIPILCWGNPDIFNLRARAMGVIIPPPIVIHDLADLQGLQTLKKDVCIDNMEMFFKRLLPCNVKAFVLDEDATLINVNQSQS